MVDTNKRSRQRDGGSDGKNQKRRSDDKEISGEGELIVYRILCPNAKIGSVIGKGGKVINSLRQETQAKIKVVDPFPNADKRVITIYSYVKQRNMCDVDDDELDETEALCPAQDALLRVHEVILDALSNKEDSGDKRGIEAEILVPSSQASTIIGKSGVIIKKLRAKCKAGIQVIPKDQNDATHSCAMSFDNFVQITGNAEAVRKALFYISAIMYNYPPKEEISLDTTVPELPPSIIIPSDLPIYPAGSFYPSAESVITPHSTVPPVTGTSHPPELRAYTDPSAAWPVYPSTLPVVPGYGVPQRSEELVVRFLCPPEKIGHVIGKGGSAIKNIRQTSGARVEVDDTKSKTEECIITVTSTESTNDEKSAAVDAVLLLQEKTGNEYDDKASVRLLVPSKVLGCLIGHNGSIVNDMRKRTRADIQISRGDKPKCASSNDELVEVSGEIGNVRDALLQIILRLREDVLRDREGTGKKSSVPANSVYSGNLARPQLLPSIPPTAPLGYDQRVETGGGLGLLSGGSLYGYGLTQGGDNAYGSLSSFSSKSYGSIPQFAEVVIPSHALSKVMGKGGANLANIQKLSGASVEIVDSKSSRYERIAQISGTPEQKRAAENMIQAFILAT